jgi:hypothetical protein
MKDYKKRDIADFLKDTSTLGRHQFLTVKNSHGEVKSAFKTSGAITCMSESDGYIEILRFG